MDENHKAYGMVEDIHIPRGYALPVDFEPIDPWPDFRDRVILWGLIIFDIVCLYGIYKLMVYAYNLIF